MGIYGIFKQIPPEVWVKVEEEPGLLNFYLKHKDKFTLNNVLLYLKEICQLKSDIALVAAESKKYEELDIDKIWRLVHFILTKDTSHWDTCNLDFIVKYNVKDDNYPLVNAIMGGVEIELDSLDFSLRYLTPGQVQEIATAIRQISPDCIKQRFYQALTPINRIYGAKGYELEDCVFWIEELSHYYNDAALLGHGMLSYLS